MSDRDKFRVVFTKQPKGLRFNSALSRHVTDMGIQYIRITLTRDSLLIRPAHENDHADKSVFKVSYVAGGVIIIAAAALFKQAEKRGLVGKKVYGDFSKKKLAYEMDLTPVQRHGAEDETAIEREKGDENPLLNLIVKPVLPVKYLRQTSKGEEGGVQPPSETDTPKAEDHLEN